MIHAQRADSDERKMSVRRFQYRRMGCISGECFLEQIVVPEIGEVTDDLLSTKEGLEVFRGT